ncbi:hypothetical protein GCM10023152_04070 [Agromyces bauzanensis]|uniref:Glycosyltransferase family 1 protein n=2 Tax=Agromyces bauzanensis TaxID=1308924 RepID=A0A917UNT8_9MICO|nr:hypothetical protein GCM10011372_06500 [Agromyces bauzanensis]
MVGARMAGPGLRSVAIARELADHVDVTFAIGVEGSGAVDFDGARVRVVQYADRAGLEELVLDSDAVFCQFIDTNVVRVALPRGVRFVYDLYNALPVETVGSDRISGFDTQPEMDREFAELLRYFRFVSRTGSYFVTSNERQRDFWLGYIMASGGLTPSSLGGRDIDGLIGLAPFGAERDEPRQRRHGLRGAHGITDDDFVIVWAGGIWDWFDAETAIRAIARISESMPRVKLVFYGTVHPNAAIGRPKSVDRARAVAEELGVLGTQVVFLDEWVPAASRADYLLDADAALSGHRESLETRFAFRTRILDHFWAGLPSLVTEGDWFADYIGANRLGLVVPCEDIDAMESAILRLVDDPALMAELRGNVAAIKDSWRWPATTRPLIEALTERFDVLPVRWLPSEPEAAPAPTPGPPPGLTARIRARLARGPVGRAWRGARRRLAQRKRS